MLVSHGSRSEAWRNMLISVEDSVENRILRNSRVSDVKSAFMEYNEPSIATRMKEFDRDGFTDIIIIPIFLTVSAHSFDDIPTIVGIKSSESEIAKLKQERIEVYKAKTNIKITPLLDFPEILGDNLVRRITMLSDDPTSKGCILVAYGDEEYDMEWTNLMKKMMIIIEDKTRINKFDYSWCGHIVNYETEPITTAIENVLKEKKQAIVLPVLVAFDEMFQGSIIGGAIDNINEKDRVKYKPDAILPDKNVENWIVNIANQYVDDIISLK